MKNFLPLLLITLSKSQDCSLDNIGLTSIEPRGIPEDTPIENPNTEPFTTNSTVYYSSSIETGTIDVNSVSVSIYTTPVQQTTEVPVETGTIDVNSVSIYTTPVQQTTEVPVETGTIDVSIYTTPVQQTTEVPVETGTIDVNSVSIYTTEVSSAETDAMTVTETVNQQQVTQSTCEYSMETIKTIVLKTIYVNTCVVDDEIKQLSEPVNCTSEM